MNQSLFTVLSFSLKQDRLSSSVLNNEYPLDLRSHSFISFLRLHGGMIGHGKTCPSSYVDSNKNGIHEYESGII